MASAALLERIKKASKLPSTAMLRDSEVFTRDSIIRTRIPVLNLALSGNLHGGLEGGITIVAGESKTFKSTLCVALVSEFLRQEKEGVCLFFDSEFGAKEAYFESAGVDMDRVVHIPITNIEEFKFEIMAQLDTLTAKDKVIIFVDSIGNLASMKEVEDALEQKAVADMTRAKQLKSVFRMVTPVLRLKNIPFVAVAHTYQTQEMYSKTVLSGGTGILYSAETVIFMRKRQNKTADGLLGFDFIMELEKSRCIRERSKIPLNVTFSGGISRWSGLLDIAVESGFVRKPSNGWYQRIESITTDDKKWRAADTECAAFWKPLLENEEFCDTVHARYVTSHGALIAEDEQEKTDE